MKICVYTIAKNEEHHVQRFCASAKDADITLILDTGSTDNTVEIANECGATVYQHKIFPWRYDTARNHALALIPEDFDVCIGMDMDEYLTEGWREEVERLWVDGVNQIYYPFKLSNTRSTMTNKIHSRFGFNWEWPVHECLVVDVRTKIKLATSTVTLVTHDPYVQSKIDKHHAMLEYAIKQYPESGRMAYYYARDLVNLQKWEQAVPYLKKYLTLDRRRNVKERALCMQHLGKCYDNLGKADESIEWYSNAVVETPLVKDTWNALANIYLKYKKYPEAYAISLMVTNTPNVTDKLRDNAGLLGTMPFDRAKAIATRLGIKNDTPIPPVSEPERQGYEATEVQP